MTPNIHSSQVTVAFHLQSTSYTDVYVLSPFIRWLHTSSTSAVPGHCQTNWQIPCIMYLIQLHVFFSLSNILFGYHVPVTDRKCWPFIWTSIQTVRQLSISVLAITSVCTTAKLPRHVTPFCFSDFSSDNITLTHSVQADWKPLLCCTMNMKSLLSQQQWVTLCSVVLIGLCVHKKNGKVLDGSGWIVQSHSDWAYNKIRLDFCHSLKSYIKGSFR